MSINATRGCAYPPIIVCMIEKVTKKNFKKDCGHKSFWPYTPTTTTGGTTPRSAPSSGPTSPPLPPSSSDPSPSSRHRGRGSSKKRGELFKRLKGLFVICNKLDTRLDNIEKHQNLLAEHQKAMYDHIAIQPPRSPSPEVVAYPPHVKNPWITFTKEESHYFGYNPSFAIPTNTAGSSTSTPTHTRLVLMMRKIWTVMMMMMKLKRRNHLDGPRGYLLRAAMMMSRSSLCANILSSSFFVS